MFWKGFRLIMAALATASLAGCSHYPFKYEPYNPRQPFASWTEMEAAVSRIENYASTCRRQSPVISCQRRIQDEYQHTLARIKATEFRLANPHINRLKALGNRHYRK